MMRFLLTPASWPVAFFGVFMLSAVALILGAMLSGATFYEGAKLFLNIVTCGVSFGTYCSEF